MFYSIPTRSETCQILHACAIVLHFSWVNTGIQELSRDNTSWHVTVTPLQIPSIPSCRGGHDRVRTKARRGYIRTVRMVASGQTCSHRHEWFICMNFCWWFLQQPLYIYIYIYIYIHTHTYINTHIYTHTHINTHMYTNTHTSRCWISKTVSPSTTTGWMLQIYRYFDLLTVCIRAVIASSCGHVHSQNWSCLCVGMCSLSLSLCVCPRVCAFEYEMSVSVSARIRFCAHI